MTGGLKIGLNIAEQKVLQFNKAQMSQNNLESKIKN